MEKKALKGFASIAKMQTTIFIGFPSDLDPLKLEQGC